MAIEARRRQPRARAGRPFLFDSNATRRPPGAMPSPLPPVERDGSAFGDPVMPIHSPPPTFRPSRLSDRFIPVRATWPQDAAHYPLLVDEENRPAPARVVEREARHARTVAALARPPPRAGVCAGVSPCSDPASAELQDSSNAYVALLRGSMLESSTHAPLSPPGVSPSGTPLSPAERVTELRRANSAGCVLPAAGQLPNGPSSPSPQCPPSAAPPASHARPALSAFPPTAAADERATC